MQLTPLKPSIPYSLFPIHRDGIGNVEQESGNRELGRQYTILGPGPRYSALGQKRGVLEHADTRGKSQRETPPKDNTTSHGILISKKNPLISHQHHPFIVILFRIH